MTSPRSQFIELIDQGAIPADKIREAIHVAKIAPDGKAWRAFIDHLLLWLGGLALGFSVVFFIAYNWDDLGRFAKFGLVEGSTVLAIIAYCRFDDRSAAAKVSLFVATLCLGVLMALYSQIYQTGADPWQLFFSWAVLMLPWAIIGRFAALWILWVVLMNTTIILYHLTFRGIFWFAWSAPETGILWLTFFFNTLILAVWEFLGEIRNRPAERWPCRLLATGSGVPLTGLVLHTIFADSNPNFSPSLIWTVWLALMYAVYRKSKPDLFMLAGCCLSIITVIVSFLGEKMLHDSSAGSFLFLALLVIGMGTGAAVWLKNVHRECQQ